jgi:hypothetical protein
LEIIDFRVRLRTKEALKAWVPKPIPQFKSYIELYKMKERLKFQMIETTISEMKKAGIRKAVLCAGSAESTDYISKVCEQFKEFFIPVAGIKFDRGAYNAYSAVRDALKYDRMMGFNFGGLLQNPPMAIDDKLLYPIYALCVDYDVPAIIHSSLHYYTGAKLELNHPFRIDNVAVDFPNLRIVMSHAGNGFGDIPLVLAQRHPNIFLEVSGLVPKHLPVSYITAMNKYLKQKFIFGTDYPLLPFEIIHEWENSLFKENWILFFKKNAMKALSGR